MSRETFAHTNRYKHLISIITIVFFNEYGMADIFSGVQTKLETYSGNKPSNQKQFSLELNILFDEHFMTH